MKHFVAGATARTTADLAGIHRNTATGFFRRLFERIALKQRQRGEQFGGEVELDESYFGGARKGKRGRGAGGKVVVFGILKRGGKVYIAAGRCICGSCWMPAQAIQNLFEESRDVYVNELGNFKMEVLADNKTTRKMSKRR